MSLTPEQRTDIIREWFYSDTSPEGDITFIINQIRDAEKQAYLRGRHSMREEAAKVAKEIPIHVHREWCNDHTDFDFCIEANCRCPDLADRILAIPTE